MRTLTLIAALLLLALQAPAELLQERADQVPAQDQPVAEHQGQPGTEVQDQPGAEVQDQPGAEGQDQPGAEGQDMAITFAGDKAHLAQNASGLRKITTCYCRRGLCHLFERRSGTCLLNGYQYRFCCR